MHCIKTVSVYVNDQTIKDWLLLVWTMTFCYVMIVRSHTVEYHDAGLLLLGRILQADRPVCFEVRQASQQARGVGPMLAHRLRRWPNIRPTLGQRPMFAVLPS